jgi:hypothetical protein
MNAPSGMSALVIPETIKNTSQGQLLTLTFIAR